MEGAPLSIAEIVYLYGMYWRYKEQVNLQVKDQQDPKKDLLSKLAGGYYCRMEGSTN